MKTNNPTNWKYTTIKAILLSSIILGLWYILEMGIGLSLYHTHTAIHTSQNLEAASVESVFADGCPVGTNGKIKNNSYDSSGNWIQQIQYARNGSERTTDIKINNSYDSSGNMTQQIQYSRNGSERMTGEKRQSSYDSSGNLIQDIQYTRNGSERMTGDKRQGSYDSSGNWIQQIQYARNGSERTTDIKINNSYDSSGNMTQQIQYSRNGSERMTGTKIQGSDFIVDMPQKIFVCERHKSRRDVMFKNVNLNRVLPMRSLFPYMVRIDSFFQ